MLRRKPKPPREKPPRRYPEVPEVPPKPRAVMWSTTDSAPVVVAKMEPLRSEPYRRWIASLPCFGCGVEGWSQCAHKNHGKGMAMKVCDAETFPLCAPHFGLIGCHQQHDLCIDMSRDQRRQLELDYVAKAQALAVADGWDIETLTRRTE